MYSNNNMQQGGHPNYQQNWQGGIQQQQQPLPPPQPVYQQQGNQYQQHQQQHHHQQGVQYQFDMATVANQQRGQPQQQIMHAPNTLLGVHQAQHLQHNQQQQQQHQIMSAQQQLQQMVTHHQHYSMVYNALETDGLKRIYRREIRSLIFFTCLEASGEWKRIWYQYGIVLIRDGVDSNSCNLKEGTQIVQPKYVCGNDILPECYDESYTKYVSNSELGKQYLRLFSSILGTDEVQQQKQKRQRLEQKLQQEDERLSIARQKMIDARLALKSGEQEFEEKEQSYQQQVKVQTELDQQIQQYKKEKESGLSISNEEDHDDEIVDKANELLMSLSLQGGPTPSEQDEYDMKIIRQMCSRVMNRRIDRISHRIKNEKKKEQKLLDTKVEAKEKLDRLAANAKIADEYYKMSVDANLASYKQVAAEVEKGIAPRREVYSIRAAEQSPNHGQTPEQITLDMVDAIMATDATQLDSFTKLTKDGHHHTKYGQPSLRFVKIDSDRCPLPGTSRNKITSTLIQRLSSVVVDENNNVKGAFQLSYRKPRSGEPNIIKVYGIPHVRLPPVDDNLFNTKTFENQREFANQYQVTLSIPEVHVVSAINEASSSDEPPITALQQILNNYYNISLPSQGERRQLFFFKGVVYFVWIDAPSEVLEMLKETCKDVYEDVRAVKIGESGEDLILHLKKMMNLLTYLAGAKLCWIAIGIPFGLCSSHMVEQWIHFIKLELRKSGEWHSREALSLETINHILNRTGGKVICRGTVSHGGKSGICFNDGAGWIYFFRQLHTEEELRELWKIYHKLSEGEGRAFIRFLLAFKVGASLGKDPMSRPRANFWAFVRGCGEYVAVKGFPYVFEQEARLHKQFERFQVCGERYMLTDANGNSEIESLLKLLRNDDRYIIEKGQLHREKEKLNYLLEGETKEWIRRDFISLVEIVDKIMNGVVTDSAEDKEVNSPKPKRRSTIAKACEEYWEDQKEKQH